MDKTLVGGAVSCFINNKNIGWVTGITISENTPRRCIGGIDTLAPYEIVPLSTEVSGMIEVVKMFGDDSLEYRGIVGGAKNIIREKYFTLMLIQRNAAGANYLLFRVDNCAVENQTWRANPRGIVTGQFSFKGIEMVNAATQAETLPV